MNALSRAIQRLDPPTQAELARRLGLAPQQVSTWMGRGWAAPRYAPAIEQLTGVTCSELVSDIPDKKADS